ncbi:MAG TPA: copper amine oxidase N-terminal domain-containing protein, partial [Symbiobacteriaceae bacterium]|nr:copper amine oxidase N-terminal domain-containing protein [Symbiobacteriaceae bacterium]
MRDGARKVWSAALALCLTWSFLGATQGIAEAAEESVVIFQVGSREYTVDGQTYEMDVAPRVDPESNRTLLPVRFAAQAMNATVYWNDEGQQITVVHNDTQRVLE